MLKKKVDVRIGEVGHARHRKKIRDEDIDQIINKNTQEFMHLHLYANKITHRGIEALNKHYWGNLTILNLYDNQLGIKGCKMVTRGSWRQLQYLIISRNSIQSAGCTHLMKNPWKGLKYLGANMNTISRDGLRHLIRSNWPQITQIQLNENHFPKDQLRFLLLIMSQQDEMRIKAYHEFPYESRDQKLKDGRLFYARFQTQIQW